MVVGKTSWKWGCEWQALTKFIATLTWGILCHMCHHNSLPKTSTLRRRLAWGKTAIKGPQEAEEDIKKQATQEFLTTFQRYE